MFTPDIHFEVSRFLGNTSDCLLDFLPILVPHASNINKFYVHIVLFAVLYCGIYLLLHIGYLLAAGDEDGKWVVRDDLLENFGVVSLFVLFFLAHFSYSCRR